MNMARIGIGRFAPHALIAACVLLAATRSPAEEVSAKSMLACAKLGADLERLSCYDRLSAKLHAEVAGTSAPSNSPPEPAAPELFGLTAAEAKPDNVKRVELKSIEAHIVAFRETRQNSAIITLDNGQKWQQEGHEDLLLKEGQKVVISRGAFASFWIVTENNRSSHVKRLL
jgi:hypothetical protein